MRKLYKNYYRFAKAPKALLKARLDNIAIVPASMLPFTKMLQEKINTLPKGAVLLCYVKENARQRKIIERVEETFRQQGHAVTNLGLSRWAGTGGSYRTVQRFFATVLPWAVLFWVFFRQHVYCPGEVYLLVGDEVVVTKAGKLTHGLDRFFSSLYGKPIPGLA